MQLYIQLLFSPLIPHSLWFGWWLRAVEGGCSAVDWKEAKSVLVQVWSHAGLG